MLDGAAVPAAARQAVAADLGFSETVFVDDARDRRAADLHAHGRAAARGPSARRHRVAARAHRPPVDTLRPPAGEVPTWREGELTWIRGRPEWATPYDVAQLESLADVDAFARPRRRRDGRGLGVGGRGRGPPARARVPERDRDRRGRGDRRRGAPVRRAARPRHRDPPGRGLRAARAARRRRHGRRRRPRRRSRRARATRCRSRPDILAGRCPGRPRHRGRSCAAAAARGSRSTPPRSRSRSSRSAGGRSSGTSSSIFAAQGVRRVLLLTGLPVRARRRVRRGAPTGPRACAVECVDTGLDTPTGGRIHAVPAGSAARRSSPPTATASPTSTSRRSRAAHAAAGAVATLTVVRPELPFGVAVLGEGDRVTGFRGEAARRALGQRRLLRLRAGDRRTTSAPDARARARAARAARRRRTAARPPPRGLLGLHGHLQGRGAAQRSVGRRATHPGSK